MIEQVKEILRVNRVSVVACLEDTWICEESVESLAKQICPLSQERVERIKGLALQAIADEPEFPGDMPDELWVELDGTRQQTTDIMRNTVRLTKEGIVGRLQALWEKELK